MNIEFNKEILKISPAATISLFKINLRNEGSYYFHAGENGYNKPLIFKGREYTPIPIEMSGFEYAGDGKLPRPRMMLSNAGGVISSKLSYFEDFLNFKVCRTKTFFKYLDKANFPNNINPYGEGDVLEFPVESYFINQKVKEDKNGVEFELVSILELESAFLPAREIISNFCAWTYRSSIGCGYAGPPVSNDKNKKFQATVGFVDRSQVGEDGFFDNNIPMPGALQDRGQWSINNLYQKKDFVRIESPDDSDLSPEAIYVCIGDDVKSDPRKDSENWAMDGCSKNIAGCRIRFGAGASSDREAARGLPFGGFPGTESFGY